jgi:hypothetical protein
MISLPAINLVSVGLSSIIFGWLLFLILMPRRHIIIFIVIFDIYLLPLGNVFGDSWGINSFGLIPLLLFSGWLAFHFVFP